MFKTTFSSRSIFTLPKGTTSNLHFFVNPYRGTSIIFCDQNKCAKISFFSKKKMLQNDKLKDRVSIVTGGGSGIGEDIVMELIRLG